VCSESSSPFSLTLLISGNARSGRNLHRESDASEGRPEQQQLHKQSDPKGFQARTAAKWQSTGMDSSHLRVGLSAFYLEKKH